MIQTVGVTRFRDSRIIGLRHSFRIPTCLDFMIKAIESPLGKLVYVFSREHDTVTLDYIHEQLDLPYCDLLPIIRSLVEKGIMEPVEVSHQDRYRVVK